MAIVKRTSEGQKQRSELLSVLRERLTKVRGVESLTETTEWKDYRDLLNSFIEMESRREQQVIARSCQEDAPEPWKTTADIRVSRERKIAFELIRDLVDKSKDQVEIIDKRIKELEETYRQATEELN